MAIKPSKKIEFSNIISTVKMKSGSLVIKQLRLFALSFMIFFLIALVYLGLTIGLKFPIIVQISLSLGVLILVWGIYDVFTTKVSFLYNIQSDFLQIKASRKDFRLNYNGQGRGHLSLSTKKDFKTDSNQDRYLVVLKYKDSLCEIPFVLSGSFSSLESAEEGVLEWEEKLNLKK